MAGTPLSLYLQCSPNDAIRACGGKYVQTAPAAETERATAAILATAEAEPVPAGRGVSR